MRLDREIMSLHWIMEHYVQSLNAWITRQTNVFFLSMVHFRGEGFEHLWNQSRHRTEIHLLCCWFKSGLVPHQLWHLNKNLVGDGLILWLLFIHFYHRITQITDQLLLTSGCFLPWCLLVEAEVICIHPPAACFHSISLWDEHWSGI